MVLNCFSEIALVYVFPVRKYAFLKLRDTNVRFLDDLF